MTLFGGSESGSGGFGAQVRCDSCGLMSDFRTCRLAPIVMHVVQTVGHSASNFSDTRPDTKCDANG